MGRQSVLPEKRTTWRWARGGLQGKVSVMSSAGARTSLRGLRSNEVASADTADTECEREGRSEKNDRT